VRREGGREGKERRAKETREKWSQSREEDLICFALDVHQSRFFSTF
jgi:hypothetical protein